MKNVALIVSVALVCAFVYYQMATNRDLATAIDRDDYHLALNILERQDNPDRLVGTPPLPLITHAVIYGKLNVLQAVVDYKITNKRMAEKDYYIIIVYGTERVWERLAKQAEVREELQRVAIKWRESSTISSEAKNYFDLFR